MLTATVLQAKQTNDTHEAKITQKWALPNISSYVAR